MTYETLATRNVSNDITELLVYANDVSGGVFVPMILASFFIIIGVGLLFSQLRLNGKFDFWVDFSVAALLTTVLSFIMMLKEGLVNPIIPVVCIGLSVGSFAILYFSTRSE